MFPIQAKKLGGVINALQLGTTIVYTIETLSRSEEFTARYKRSLEVRRVNVT